MRKLFLMLLGLLSLAVIACGPPVQPQSDLPCGGEDTYCGQDADGADICVDLSSDPAHCGSCTISCRDPEANACLEGLCACVGVNHNASDACDDPTVCVEETGQCIFPDYGTTETCDPIDGVPCEDPNKVCAAGHCTLPDCNHPEICDGWDNDCDGHLDSTGPHPGQSIPIARACYNGDPSTLGLGTCRAGQQLCFFGNWTPADGSCPGELLPVPEDGILNCDGLDNDCNDCVDDHLDEDGALACGPHDPQKVDIVFIIDRSGSMNGTIAAVVWSIQSWATSIGTNPNIRFALINPTTTNDSDGVSLTVPLSDYVTFNAAMAGVSANGTGFEPMHYATQLTLSGAFDADLGYAPDTIHLVIAIHDESTVVSNSVAGYDETSVCGSVPTDTILAVITYPTWFSEWDLCTSSTAIPPSALPLTSDPAAMLMNLETILDSVCY